MPDPPSPNPEPLSPLAPAEPASPPPPSPFSPYFRPPRLGIIHFLAWITLSAVLLGLLQSFNQYAEETLGDKYSGYRQSVGMASFSVPFILIAAELVGMAVVIRGRLSHQPGRWQPGHFLIVVHSFFDLISSLFTLAILLFLFHPDSSFKFFYTLISLILTLGFWIKAALLFWWWKRSLDLLRWKVLFCLEAILTLTMSLGSIVYAGYVLDFFHSALIVKINPALPYITFARPFLLMGIFIVVAILDYRKGPRRDWVHWLGISTAVLMWLYCVVTYL
ncbi:MAG: hypothetical protein JXB10_17465 [Pirellulales bacterium]|nr:hypothetical protein [Pirellulales bacterium]